MFPQICPPISYPEMFLFGESACKMKNTYTQDKMQHLKILRFT